MPVAAALKNLSLDYPTQKKALKNISWEIKTGEWWAICGSNGSGKTSLLYALAELIPNYITGNLTGKIEISRSVGIVFQNPDFSLFNLTVQEEVAFGHKGNIEPVIKAVDMWPLRSADPQTLSYGAKQKVCLAAVLARDPDIILLDEPTSMLDYKSSINLYEILNQLHEKGKTIIVVEHNTGLVAAYTQKTLLLDQGKVIKAGPTKTVFKDKALISRLGLEPIK
jgi:energy-coupling factor transporter ATP-binding protein EcfA2